MSLNLRKLKKKLKAKPKKENKSKYVYLSTGSTLLNCAVSDKARGGWIAGKYYLVVGDSASGKTALSLTCFAEASINPKFDEYDLIHDDVEGGALFNIKKLFGRKLAKRLKTIHSETVEECFYNIDNQLKTGRPFIYVVDSTDALDTEEDESKFQERKKAHAKRKEGKAATVTGSYAVSKPKIISANLRRLMTPLWKSKSILIFISQTRDNLGFGYDKKTRSGGRALKFYATLEVWSSIKKKLKKKVRGQEKKIGIISEVKVKKSRTNGKEREVEIPIYYSVGFDDTGGCIDFLVANKEWKRKGKKIATEEFGTMSREKLIQKIEKNDLRSKLQNIVGRVWQEIEDELDVKRISKYA